MGTEAEYIKDQKLNKRPDFYNNVSGLPWTSRTDSGGVVNSSVLPIVKRITKTVEFKPNTDLTAWELVSIGYDIGQVLYVFVRWKLQGSDTWQMCNQTNYDVSSSGYPPRFWIERIENSYIQFGYFDNLEVPPTTKNIEIDACFVNVRFKT